MNFNIMYKFIKELFMKKIKYRGLYDTRTKASDNILIKTMKDDNNYNPSAFFLIVTTIIGILLLLVPLCLFIEMFYNHTITTDLNGMAAYIVSVVSIFAAGGLTHGWTEFSKNKYNQLKDIAPADIINESNKEHVDDFESIETIEEIKDENEQ